VLVGQFLELLWYYMLVVKIKKLTGDAVVPNYAHEWDAGMDLFSAARVVIAAGGRVKVPTGIAMEIPDEYVGLIWDKSGLSMNKGLKTLGGVVDSGYRGEVMVGIANLSGKEYIFEKGDKVAQMIIQKKEYVQIEEVDKLGDTARGADGFGSTGT